MTARTIAIIGNQGSSLLNFRGDLIGDLVARGHVVYALAPQMDADISSALRALGCEPVEFPMARTGTNPITDLKSFLVLCRILSRLKPDVVLGYTAKPAIYGTLAAWLAGIPARFAMIEGLGYIFIPQPAEGVRKKILRTIVVGLFRFSLRRSRNVFFLNPDDIADFSALGLVRSAQAVNIGGIGVDLDVWRPAPVVLEPVTFLFIGRLLKEKGILDFVAAARRLKASHPATRFLLVGGIDENPGSVSHTEVKCWVAEGLLEWPGHVSVAPWLRQTSVFVLPSYREGVPRSTQEAMAMGRPVITTDAPGCRETVIHGVNGYLVPPRDPEALERAMQAFVNEPHLITVMGAESRRLAEVRFNVRRVNAMIMEAMGL